MVGAQVMCKPGVNAKLQWIGGSNTSAWLVVIRVLIRHMRYYRSKQQHCSYMYTITVASEWMCGSLCAPSRCTTFEGM